jgi:hypothetical protein
VSDAARSEPKAGGHATATLNHLVSPAPVKEWADCIREEDQLLERLARVMHDRARHELALRIAGVTREQLQASLQEPPS